MKIGSLAIAASIVTAVASTASADVGIITTTNKTVQSVAQVEFEVSLVTNNLVYRKANGRWRVDWAATAVSYEAMSEMNQVRDDFAMWTYTTTDCNDNGIPDNVDIANGAPDTNHNGVPDSCEYAVGDLNLDGRINQADLYILLGWWGTATPQYGDLNGDGKVDGQDLGYELGRFGLLVF